MVSQSPSWIFSNTRDPRDRVPFRPRSFTPPGFCVTAGWALTSMGQLDALLARLERAGAASAPRLSLPAIPRNYIRLTHVMPERSRQILSSGEPFLYGRYGIAGTTDAYLDNQAIEYLARTGNPMGPGSAGNWSRNDFGDHMALIDLPAETHKQIFQTLDYDTPIPNAAILGFVDRPRMLFEPNPRYSLEAIEQYAGSTGEQIRRLVAERNRIRFGDRRPTLPPMPPPPLAANPDVW